jgi:hypothetical protein
MATLFRSMKEDLSDQHPLAEWSARGLGVRPGIDISVDDFGLVESGAGGMSVSQDDPAFLPEHRRPPSHGGTGPDPLWTLEENNLYGERCYERDMSPIAELQEAVQTRHPLVSLRDAVKTAMDDRGFSREDVLAMLQELRARYHDEGDAHAEDIVLDTMDFVTGWCSPHMKIRTNA